ncbi:MAG: hypothetical protein C4581_11320 [Nitrospiraceae bacterium]|nr:MAG: hypothetical protein C4581_11320 [Nitrospiraceae bacterium]
MEHEMETSESLYETSAGERREYIKADLLSRVIAKTIDFIIVVALYEMIPKVGFFAGITYLLIADGLFDGRSAGKKLIGLKVIVPDKGSGNTACEYKESIYRNFPFAVGFILYGVLKAIPLIGWIIAFVIVVGILLFESLVILGSEEGMRLGDELAKTRVVQDKEGGVNV